MAIRLIVTKAVTIRLLFLAILQIQNPISAESAAVEDGSAIRKGQIIFGEVP